MRRSRPRSAVSAALLLAAWVASATEQADPSATAVDAGRQVPDRAVDRLELDASVITGSRELPKVLSIVPWKSAEPPEGPDRPMGSLIEEVLSPVDHAEFRREITYFRDLSSHITPGQQGGPPTGGPDPAPPESSSRRPGANEQ